MEQIQKGDWVIPKNKKLLFIHFPSLTKGQKYKVSEFDGEMMWIGGLPNAGGMLVHPRHFNKYTQLKIKT